MVHVCVCARVSRVRGIIKLNSRILHERPAWREKGQGRNIGINRRDEEIPPLSPLLQAVAKRPVRKAHPATCDISTRPIFSDCVRSRSNPKCTILGSIFLSCISSVIIYNLQEQTTYIPSLV